MLSQVNIRHGRYELALCVNLLCDLTRMTLTLAGRPVVLSFDKAGRLRIGPRCITDDCGRKLVRTTLDGLTQVEWRRV